MRRELAKAIRDTFTAQLTRVLPQFRPLRGQRIGAGCYAYAWRVGEALTFFVMLQISTKAFEEFTVELAFSKDEQFPIDSFPGLPFHFADTGIQAIATDPQRRFRLADLWRQHEKNLDYWWEVTPRPSSRELAQRLKDLASRGYMDQMPLDEALRRVEPAVTEAIGKLTDYGLPFLIEVARHRGIQLQRS